MTETVEHIIADETPPRTRLRDALWFRIAKWVVIVGVVLGLIAAVILTVWTIRATEDLPSVETLSEYRPPVMSRVHAGDGKLISEFRTEARVFVPIESVPLQLQQAFIASEDKRFFRHNGWDPIGLTRAALTAPGKKMRGERIGGTSTITQQVAKNFLVGRDYSMKRKVREIFIARRMEKAFTKGEILELYLNDNYFGRGAYGVAAAALNHFGKEMDDLSIGEMAYLALVVKGPANYELDDPREYAAAKQRQRYVLDRMAEDGYITQAEADAAHAEELVWTDRLSGAEYLAAEYFVEEARKQIFAMYGSDELYSGGLSIRTTLDTDMQLAGRRALRRGIELLDRRMGWRGPLTTFETLGDWAEQLAAFDAPNDIGDWRVAVVLERSQETAELGFVVETDEDEVRTETGRLDLEDVLWAGRARDNGRKGPAPTSLETVIEPGDVVLVQAHLEKDGAYNLRQIPEVNGALIAMDPHTGRVKALIGGYSFDQSEFNRVTQAYRQPGSSFKPFVYATALLEGYTPSTQVLDSPFVIPKSDGRCVSNELGVLERRGAYRARQNGSGGAPARRDQCERFYKPQNFDAGRYYGLSTLRLGIEKSRNAMTVRLANDVGMEPIINLAQRFGIYDNPRPELAWSLGAGETNLLRLATAYSMMVNGGKRVVPSILDRVQDGQGNTIFLNSSVACPECRQDDYTGQAPPVLPDAREQIVDPITAYQITYMMIGAVENGTGAKMRALGRPVGGKTGTTNDSKDNWFMSFTPDLVVGVYVGKDTPEQMANETGSSSAVPIVLDFMTEVLEDEPVVPFRIPDGMTMSPVNRNTGTPSFIGAPNVILEAYRPGTEPKVGSLDTTIRIGSGDDTFGSNFFGDGEEILDDGTPDGFLPDQDAPAVDPLAEAFPIPNMPTPRPTDPEPKRDLEDGLY
ncbi:transglycosylase domain-containing protein [uncultured Algimonas sp.]|uniref:penicillin-binding protein 1A n=1 Tax=uncultured Algimonas sp. TaxID=1547920 RepID=UPI00260733CF|nr:transglycosylase domain-containing protein [uncultured Algimonas sp.]